VVVAVQRKPKTGPDWDHLFNFAVGQEGHFTTKQAAESGYSPQLLAKYLSSGRIMRVRRSVYRIVHFPASEHEDLATLWLWSECVGVFSHETALMLHQLSDALPRKVHLVLPLAWAARRLRVPKSTTLAFVDLASHEVVQIGAIPVTTIHRTLADCIDAHVSPELVLQAIQQALARAYITKREAAALRTRMRRPS
jgi:predicted transcriptional regulator of viral defense system